MGKRIRSISGSCPYMILSIGFGKAAFFILFLFFNSLYSQEGLATAPTISLSGNAKIYSVDSDFNQQFISQKNADYEISSSGKAYVFTSKADLFAKRITKRKSKVFVQNQSGLKKIKKSIADFEQQKKLFDFCNIHGAPLSRELPYSSGSSRNYIIPSTTSHDFSKASILQYKYLIRLVLELNYACNYHYFNNRSLDFCFSKVFSVRPPPLFLI